MVVCVVFASLLALGLSQKGSGLGTLGNGVWAECEEVLSEKATQEVLINIRPASTQASHIVSRQMPHGGMVKGAPPAVASRTCHPMCLDLPTDEV